MVKNKIREENEDAIIGFRLKDSEPNFTVTREGPFEYHRFQRGEIYEKVPEEDRHRFEIVRGGEEK